MLDRKFPVVKVSKGAIAAPFANLRELILSFVLMSIAVGVMAGYALSNGLTMDVISSMGNPENSELVDEYAGVLGITYLIAIFVVGPVSAYLFNYWVRLGAYGKEGTAFETTKAAVVATLTNMAKFALIFLLMGLVSIVLGFLMVLLGVGAGPDELAATMQGHVSVSTVVTNVINLIMICVIYSLFSANLTQTALKSDKEDLKHPHTVDFALVLFLLYLVAFIPGTFVSLLGVMWVNIAMQATVGVYVAFAIAVAHGFRYQICVAEKAEATE